MANYKQICEHINAHNLKRAQNRAIFPQAQASANDNYPITNMIAQLELDRVYVGRALKNLESKGNLGARELLLEDIQELEHNLSYFDLLQEFRMECMEQEQESKLSLVYDMERKSYKIIAMRVYASDFSQIEINGKNYTPIISDEILAEYNQELESALFKALFRSVTKYLYEHKTVIEKKHISYDIELESGEHKLVDMLDRKALAQYAKSEKLHSDREFRAFLKHLKANTIEKAQEKRVNILYSLIDGLTYQEISDLYGYKLSTIGKDVQAIRELYKDYFGIHKPSAQEQFTQALKSSTRAEKLALLDIRKKPLAQELKSSKPSYHYDLIFGHDYLGIGAQAPIEERERKLLEQERELEQELKSSPIKPHKSKFERAEKLFKYRQEHCKKRSIRSNVLRYEQAIRKELERAEKFDNKAQELGAIRYEESEKHINVYYGEKLVHTLKIAK